MHICRGRFSDRVITTCCSSYLCLGALLSPAWPSLLRMLISFLLCPVLLCSWISDPPFIFKRCSLSPGLIVVTHQLVVRLAPTPSTACLSAGSAFWKLKDSHVPFSSPGMYRAFLWPMNQHERLWLAFKMPQPPPVSLSHLFFFFMPSPVSQEPQRDPSAFLTQNYFSISASPTGPWCLPSSAPPPTPGTCCRETVLYWFLN